MSLLKYTVRRLLMTIPILFGVIFITFILSHMMPGNPFLKPGQFIKGNPEYVRALLEKHGLNDPIIVQFLKYLKNMLQGDWGESLIVSKGIPVWDLIKVKVPVTLEVGIYALIISSILGIRTGVYSAVHRNKPGDTIIRTVALLGVAMPVFWLGILMQYFLSIKLGLFPTIRISTIGYDDPIRITSFRLIDSLLTGRFDLAIDTAWHLVLPVFALSFLQVAGLTRYSRSSMLEILELDYVRSARAKGCKERDVINKHALKNALIPIVTIIGLRFGGVIGGAILTETTFNLKGMGMLFVDAVNWRDYFVINGLVFITTFVFIVMVVFVDILYAVIDPRIRY
ncbi:MAG: ABC transporter permease [Candidatus Lokiarchaeota archaeon]|nr:ABC transporter permease [Candidatus Lokiarchaeota archaeon]